MIATINNKQVHIQYKHIAYRFYILKQRKMIAKKSLNNQRFLVTFLPKKCVERVFLLPVKDDTTFTKSFTKIRNWKMSIFH